MQLARLLFLLLVTLVANAQAIGHRFLPDRPDAQSESLLPPIDGDTSASTKAQNEERGLASSVFSKVKRLFRKNSGFSTKLGNTRNEADLVAAVEKIPVVKKLETVVEKDPAFLKKLSDDPEAMVKLAKDPQVARVSAMMEKNNVKVQVTKESMTKLRSAVGKDPAKLGALDVIDGLVSFGIMATAGALVIALLGFAFWGSFAMAPAFK